MEEVDQFMIYPYCNPIEFFDVYQKLYGDEFRTKNIEPPLEFLRSQHSTPLSATISISLFNLKNQIFSVLQQQKQPQQSIAQAQSINWGKEFQDLPQIDINENDLFVSQTIHKNIQLVHLLKSAGMDILRFISQLTDMYNDKEFTNRNKSLSSLLGQDRLQMQEADILTEMRHSLTHKQFPSIQSLISAIDYLLIYLKDSFWDKLQQEFEQVNIHTNNQQNQIIKKIRKQVKTRSLSKKDFILYGRHYLKQQLSDLYKANEFVFEGKIDVFTKLVRQLCESSFHADHLLVYLLSKIIKQAGFMVSEKAQDQSQFILKRLSRQKKLKITSQYLIGLFSDQPQNKTNYFKSSFNRISKRINVLLQRMQNIAIISDEMKTLLNNLKSQAQIIIGDSSQNVLNITEIDEVSSDIDKYLQEVQIKKNSILFGYSFNTYLGIKKLYIQ